MFPDSKSTALQKAQLYYKACMDTSKNNIKPFQELIKSLGSWPVTSDPVSGQWSAATWNFQTSYLATSKLLNYPFFSITPGPDLKNKSVTVLTFDQGYLTYPSKLFYNGSLEAPIHDSFINKFTTIGTLLGGILLLILHFVIPIHRGTLNIVVVVVEVFNQTNVKRISPKSTNKNTTNQSIYISIKQSMYKVLTDNSVMNRQTSIVWSVTE